MSLIVYQVSRIIYTSLAVTTHINNMTIVRINGKGEIKLCLIPWMQCLYLGIIMPGKALLDDPIRELFAAEIRLEILTVRPAFVRLQVKVKVDAAPS